MSYTCPRCGAVSHHPKDEEQRYCARCNMFEEDVMVEYDCKDCGVHVYACSITAVPVGSLCATCVWLAEHAPDDPELRKLLLGSITPQEPSDPD